MPLHDHHRPPLSNVLQWNSFHHAWLTYLATDLNQFLPPEWYAEPGARFGIEVDVAALERMHDSSSNGAARDWQPVWTSPPAVATIPFAVATDEEEVRVYGDPGEGMRLVGAVEFISPANKDRPETRRNFAIKCHSYLQQGVGLVLVDTVSDMHFNLHDELLDLMGQSAKNLDADMYVTAYRPTGKNGEGTIEMWLHRLELGGELPEVPLWLNGGLCVPARLSETYCETCRGLRVVDRLRHIRKEVPR